MPPFLIAGAVYIAQRLSGTFTKFVWRPTGLVDILENPPPEVRAKNPELFKVARFFIDLNEGFAYDPTTREGQVEMLADVAALGFKLGALKLGLPLVSRLAGVIGTRFGVVSAANLPGNIGKIVDILSGRRGLFDDLTDAWDKANALLEEGKAREPEARAVIEKGTKAAVDSFEFAGALGLFVATPSVLAAPALILKGVDAVTSILEFFTAAIPFLPEPRQDELADLGLEGSRFKRKKEVTRTRAPKPRTIPEIVEDVVVTFEEFPIDDFMPPPGEGFPFGVPPTTDPIQLQEVLKSGVLSRIINRVGGGVTDLQKIIAELKKRV